MVITQMGALTTQSQLTATMAAETTALVMASINQLTANQMNWFKQKQDMIVQLEERMVHMIQVQELLSNGVMWWQRKLTTL